MHPEDRKYVISAKYPHAHARRTAKVSTRASGPHLIRQRRRRRSSTERHGCEPLSCSSRNLNGATGTVRTAWSVHQVERFNGSGIAPDAMMGRMQAARSGLVHAVG